MKYIAMLLLIISSQLLTACSSTPVQSSTPTAATAATPREVEGSYQQALAAMQAEQWQAAREQLQQLTTQQPSLSGPWVNLGITQTMLGDQAAAETSFRKAIDTNSRNTEAYNQLGMLYRRQGHHDKAQFIYEEALRQAPDDANIHWNLAILYDRYLPNPHQALQHYQRYQQLTGSSDPQLQAWIKKLDNRTLTAGVKP